MHLKKLIIFLFFLSFFNLCYCQEKDTFYLIEASGAIDLGLANFIERAISEAKEKNIKGVILEIDTFGGRVDAALQICTALEKAKPLATVAFIAGNAWSAGALIALATQKIVMSSSATIGSAEPRAAFFNLRDELSDEKIISAMRAKFRSVAEANGFNPALAEAMVDKDVEIKLVSLKGEEKILSNQELEEIKSLYAEGEIKVIQTISPKGKLLNLSAQQAQELGLSIKTVSNRKGLLNYLGIEEERVIFLRPNWSENLVRFLTHPLISSLFLTLGFLGLFFELKSPGWGISGSLGVIFLALFFWGHYLVGLANWIEIVLFALGLTLLLFEIFVFPGFGVGGLLGILFILTGVFLALLKFPLVSPYFQLKRAFNILSYAIIFTGGAAFFVIKLLARSKLARMLVLDFKESKEEGFKAKEDFSSYLGKEGRALTPLRPAGKIELEGKIFDAISAGNFISLGEEVVVESVEEGKLMVREK